MVMTQLSLGDFYCLQKVRFKTMIALTCAAMFMSGCSTVGPDFTSMTEAYERAIDMHQRKSILVNIMRASDSLPLVFTDVTTVSGTGSIAMSGSLNANISSADPSSFNGFFSSKTGSSAGLSTGLATNRSFTFSLGSLNNEEFYRGFLTETTLDDLYFYMSSGVPRKEFIGSLLIDSIQVTDSAGKSEIYWNEPLLPNYERFQNKLYELVDSGLTVEMKTQARNIGPELSKEELHWLLPDIIGDLNASKISLQPAKTKPGSYQIVKTVSGPRVCFDDAAHAARYGNHMVCESSVIAGGAIDIARKNSSSAKETILIKLRSTSGVFRYLGKLVELQIGPKKEVTKIRIRTPNGDTFVAPIFVVLEGSTYNEPLLASVNYQGEDYSIPKNDSGFSSRVLQLMSTMVIMNKIPGSIPASPGVLIR